MYASLSLLVLFVMSIVSCHGLQQPTSSSSTTIFAEHESAWKLLVQEANSLIKELKPNCFESAFLEHGTQSCTALGTNEYNLLALALTKCHLRWANRFWSFRKCSDPVDSKSLTKCLASMNSDEFLIYTQFMLYVPALCYTLHGTSLKSEMERLVDLVVESSKVSAVIMTRQNELNERLSRNLLKFGSSVDIFEKQIEHVRVQHESKLMKGLESFMETLSSASITTSEFLEMVKMSARTAAIIILALLFPLWAFVPGYGFWFLWNEYDVLISLDAWLATNIDDKANDLVSLVSSLLANAPKNTWDLAYLILAVRAFLFLNTLLGLILARARSSREYGETRNVRLYTTARHYHDVHTIVATRSCASRTQPARKAKLHSQTSSRLI